MVDKYGAMTSETDSNAPNSDHQESAQEATKRRFREALEAKQGRQGADHVDADPHPSEHAHGPVDAKRTFRRKTG
jgi:hypothetical protein